MLDVAELFMGQERDLLAKGADGGVDLVDGLVGRGVEDEVDGDSDGVLLVGVDGAGS